VNDLIGFLRAQLEEDERLARETGDAWIPLGPHPDDRRPIARLMSQYNPARVLAEVQSKRLILDECAYWYGRTLDSARPTAIPMPDLAGRFEVAMAVLRFLVAPYAERPGYLEEWRP
jgi:hypothetical protein